MVARLHAKEARAGRDDRRSRKPQTMEVRTMANSTNLNGKRVAILVADGFEQVELTGPREALTDAGARTVIVSPANGTVEGWKHFDKGERFDVDVPLNSANADEF